MPANAGDVRETGSISGSGRSSGGGNGNPLQSSCLENFMDRGSWRLTVHVVAKSWIQLSTHACILTIFFWSNMGHHMEEIKAGMWYPRSTDLEIDSHPHLKYWKKVGLRKGLNLLLAFYLIAQLQDNISHGLHSLLEVSSSTQRQCIYFWKLPASPPSQTVSSVKTKPVPRSWKLSFIFVELQNKRCFLWKLI